MKKIPILYSSPLWEYGGICKSSREYLKQLMKKHKVWITQHIGLNDIKAFGKEFLKGYNTFDLTKKHLTILYGWTHEWFKFAKHKLCIGYNVYEGDNPPFSWINNMNNSHIKEVFVPSNYVKKVYEKAGVKKPIRVLPHCVDNIYKPKKVNKAKVFNILKGSEFLKGKFVFFGMGAIYGVSKRDRKGLDILLEAFDESFGKNPNVALLIKVNLNYAISSHLKLGTKFDLNSYIGQFVKPGCKNIFILVQDLNEEQLVNVYNAVDCGVFPARAEGFGMCQQEMMAVGKPVITTDFSGTNDFSQKSLRIKVKCFKFAEFDHVSDQRIPYVGTKWSEPNKTDLKRLMKKVYNNYKTIKKSAEKHGKKIRTQYSKHIIGKLACKLVENVYKKY
ncbi:MAG: glycosyltransferase family 4 protein [Halanaerobiales bacterium]|nr:glycosyltransferase family 4 protein [Halanaerobiales bacterium]